MNKVKKNKKFLALVLAAIIAVFALAACSTKADTVNHNLDKDAESFKVFRKIIFYNGITDKQMLEIQGFCSIEYGGRKIDVTCKEGEQYYRNTLTRSNNSFILSQQLQNSDVSDTRYKFIVRPGSLIPDVDVQ